MPAQFAIPLKPAFFDHYPVGTYLNFAIDDLFGVYKVVSTANRGAFIIIEELDAIDFPEEALKFKLPKKRVNPEGDNS